MIWPSIFLISIVQGLFLIFLVLRTGRKNFFASRLLVTLILLIVLTNSIYLVIRSALRYSIPQVFGLTFGMMQLFGPLLFFYSRSVIDQSFQWKKKYWLHFLPYLAQITFNISFLAMDKNTWNWFISTFLQGDLNIPVMQKIIFPLQCLQLFFYLYVNFRWLHSIKKDRAQAPYIISVGTRIKWLQEFTFCFFLFWIVCIGAYVYVLVNGKYDPVTNYLYTLVTSAIIYFVAGKLVFSPEPLTPGFVRKYRTCKNFPAEDGAQYIQKIKRLMTDRRIYTDPNLKLALLSAQIGLPAHQVSKLINEKFGKSYNDFINEYRVREFIDRVNRDDFESYSIYGIALDVGFSSKSSFNAAFKKITGKTPSDFKKL